MKNITTWTMLVAALAAGVVSAEAAATAPDATVTVDPASEVGPIKPMNAVNNGPMKARSDQTRSNFRDYRNLRVPFARTHDAAHSTMGHSCDITGMFPDFDADENDPKSYDFTITDEYLETIRAAGTEPFFRLGQTIEHYIKKYGVNPPKDFAKWARICEHVIMHYNEGWADGHRWNIRYWEIWNEPDNHPAADGRQSPTWTGTEEQFFDLFAITAKRLKARFPELKIGGPALSYSLDWTDRFLAYCEKEKVPLDFFSWHLYHDGHDDWYVRKSYEIRKRLDAHGYAKTESILDEWNYVMGWGREWVYSLETESGANNLKGAAYMALNLVAHQNAPTDMLMYYDCRTGCAMNGVFGGVGLEPLKGYYALYAWAKLRDLGVQVKSSVQGADFWACAAKGKDGKIGIFVVRYSNDNNIIDKRVVSVAIPGVRLDGATCHLTDPVRSYTEVPATVNADGSLSVVMAPHSFVYVELP